MVVTALPDEPRLEELDMVLAREQELLGVHPVTLPTPTGRELARRRRKAAEILEAAGALPPRPMAAAVATLVAQLRAVRVAWPKSGAGAELPAALRQVHAWTKTAQQALFGAKHAGAPDDDAPLLRALRVPGAAEQRAVQERRGAHAANETHPRPRYCLCRGESAGFMVACALCQGWFHGPCVKYRARASTGPRPPRFVCPECRPAPRPTLYQLQALRRLAGALPLAPAAEAALAALCAAVTAWAGAVRRATARADRPALVELGMQGDLLPVDLEPALESLEALLEDPGAAAPPLPPAPGEPRYCLCRLPAGDPDMIQCDVCEEWFHFLCVGLDDTTAAALATYCCPLCAGPELAREDTNADAAAAPAAKQQQGPPAGESDAAAALLGLFGD
jgi:hypothetical protein